MQKFLYRFLPIVMLVFVTTIQAQDPMGLYYMQTIPQSSFINPAMQPRAHGFFALPSVNQNFKSDVAFNDAFQKTSTDWVSPLSSRYDFSKLKRTTGQSLNFQESLDMGLVGLGFRSGRDYFTLNLSAKNVMQTGVPYDFVRIGDKGFPNGSTFDFTSLRVTAYSYKEIALGYSREWNEKLTLGVKVKPLFGMVGATTDINSFTLKTSRELWQVNISGTASSSGPIEVEQAANPNDFAERIEFRDLEDDDFKDYLTSFDNMGVAFDLGAVYELNSRWSFSAALVNLGYINWKKDLNSATFSGDFSFDGVDLDGPYDELEEVVDILLDELKENVDYQFARNKFKTNLSPELYAGALYELTPSVTMGVLSRSIFQKYNFRQDFNFSANVQPYSFVSVNLNYSVNTDGGNGLGTALSFLLGPLQIYAMADYLPTRYSDVTIDSDEFTMMPYAKNLSVKVGLNLIFGRHGYRDRPMLARNR